MDFVLRINCDNDAFGDNALSRDIEVSYILGRIAQSLEDGKSYGTIRDTNGNTVGEYEYVPSGKE